MILANISVPLLGFVDTAVVGHLAHPGFLAGTALGSLLVTVMFWLLGFLRMSTTGLVAQASDDEGQQAYVIGQGLLWSCLLAVLILTFQSSLFSGLLLLVDQSNLDTALVSAEQYFSIRVWIAPLALMNIVFAGFYIGRGLTKFVLYGVLLSNSINLVLDILFVPVWGLGVSGVAYATVAAEVGLFVYYGLGISRFLNIKQCVARFSFMPDLQMVKLNTSLFFRSFLLQLCISFLTIYATRFGEVSVAINAILMQFFLFISFSLDGVAFALESLVGKAKGRNNINKLRLYIRTGVIMASGFAVFYIVFYWLLNAQIVALLTDLEQIKSQMDDYVIWIILFPLVSYISFVMDGIFVGLAWSRQMLTSMFIAACVFFMVFMLSKGLLNHGLWLAFSCFMFARGISQTYILVRQYQRL
ncbi:MAG: MATE family efflux transporter [Gammaproteobacteria bacterium]|nr:MATE family efflux transporter [Gammaproteobacteria bacterium]